MQRNNMERVSRNGNMILLLVLVCVVLGACARKMIANCQATVAGSTLGQTLAVALSAYRYLYFIISANGHKARCLDLSQPCGSISRPKVHANPVCQPLRLDYQPNCVAAIAPGCQCCKCCRISGARIIKNYKRRRSSASAQKGNL